CGRTPWKAAAWLNSTPRSAQSPNGAGRSPRPAAQSQTRPCSSSRLSSTSPEKKGRVCVVHNEDDDAGQFDNYENRRGRRRKQQKSSRREFLLIQWVRHGRQRKPQARRGEGGA